MQATADELLKLSDSYFNSQERVNAESTWEELSYYLLNSQSGIFNQSGNQTKGVKLAGRIYDSTGQQASSDLASALNDTLTNRAIQWAKIRAEDETINDDEASLEWIEDSINRMFRALDKSNFYTEATKCYESYAALANAVMLQEDREPKPDGSFNGFVFRAIHLSQVAWAANHEGTVDTVFRKFKLTAKQAVEQFGIEKLGDKITRAYEKGSLDEFEFLHAVYPRPKAIKNYVKPAKPEDRAFKSCYISCQDRNIVKEDGYYMFPYKVMRHSLLANEVIARGCGHVAINDIRTLNQYVKTDLKAKELAALPPIMVGQRAVSDQIDLRPGGVTVLSDISQFKQYETQARFDINQIGIEDLRSRIRSYFYLDKLLLPPREKIGEMTAYETAQRVQEMQRILGPTFSRLNDDWLSPIIFQTFYSMLRQNAFKPRPERLKGYLEIEFINPLARAQKIEQVNAIQQWLQLLAGFANLGKVEALDHVAVDSIAVSSGRILGVPESAIESQDNIDKIREQRQKAMQQQIQLDSQLKAADIQSKMQSGTSNPQGNSQ